MTVIEELDNANRIKASLSLKIFLIAILDYLRKKTISLGEQSYAPIELIVSNPSSILERNVPRYIHTKCNLSELKVRLYKITFSLIGNIDDQYLSIADFLFWFEQDTQDIGYLKPKFTDRHPLFIPLLIPALSALLYPVIGKLIELFLIPKG
jgi:hypothetical protein